MTEACRITTDTRSWWTGWVTLPPPEPAAAPPLTCPAGTLCSPRRRGEGWGEGCSTGFQDTICGLWQLVEALLVNAGRGAAERLQWPPPPQAQRAATPSISPTHCPAMERESIRPVTAGSERPESSPRQERAAPRQERAAPRRERAAPRRECAAPRRECAAPRRECAAPRRERATPRRECAAPRRRLAHDSCRRERDSARLSAGLAVPVRILARSNLVPLGWQRLFHAGWVFRHGGDQPTDAAIPGLSD